jgi:hypothetical protein
MKFGAILREVAGWILIAVGLWAFRESWLMLRDRQIFEAPTMTVIGFLVFRGGIHLLKVSVAARITAQASRQIEEAARKPRLPLPKPLLPRK